MEKIQRMVRQFVYVLFVSLVMGVSSACRHAHPFVLDGRVMDGGNGMAYIYRYGNKNFQLIDSVAYKNGRFTYKGTTGQPLLYGVSVDPHDTDPQSFFVGEDTLKLSFWKTGKEVIAYDSPMNDSYLSMRGNAAGASEQAILRYVHDHPSSPVTAFFVWHDWSWRLDIHSLRLVYDTLSPSLKDCIYLQQIRQLITHMENVQPGRPVPETALLKSGRQQTVFVFFATWCPDCEKEFPAIEQQASMRKDIRFVGFSLDVDKKDLAKFEERHPHMFSHVISDYKGWDSPVVQAYAVRWIPTFFLISKEGKIEKVSHSLGELF